MLLFIPRSLCALKRVAAKSEHARYGATQGIRIAVRSCMYRAEATDGHRALVVQGLVPVEEPPWPGFKETPDDAFQTVVLPKDLERACKLGDSDLQSRISLLGIATVGNDVCLGLGTDVVTARTVEGRFPSLDQVMPKKRPLFTFRVDPKVFAETLLAMADLLPDGYRGVQCFYYGDGLPLGFCAKNPETGVMIDALVVPLVLPKPDPKAKEGKESNAKTPEADATVANGQPPSDAATPDTAGQDATASAAEQADANGQEPKPNKRSKKTTA